MQASTERKQAPTPAGGDDLPDLPAVRLFGLTVGLLGLQFCWAVQVGNATRSLLELGLSATLVSYAWLAGPIAGIVVQPLVGTWSDGCRSRLGRRRPFLLAGSGVTILCLLLFAYAQEVGVLLGDGAEIGSKRPRGLFVAVAAFWTLDFALNAAQGPLRALLADVVPTRQHPAGNSWFALMTGLGNLSGAAAGALPLARILPAFPRDVAALYALAGAALAATILITVLCTPERALPTQAAEQYRPLVEPPTPRQGPLRRLWEAALDAPEPFHRLFAIQCCTWISWFCLYVFGTSWVGTAVYGGDPHALKGSVPRELYGAGVRAGNLGLALQSVVTVSVSLLIPRALRTFGVRTVYLGSHLVLGAALFGCLWVSHASMAVFLFGATGLPWAVTMAVPWALMGQGVALRKPGSEGVYFTLFNLSQCFPEVLVSFVSPGILRAAQGRQVFVLAAGGLAALIGGAAVIALGVGNGEEQEGVVEES